MAMVELIPIKNKSGAKLYRLKRKVPSALSEVIVSTPETRAICNDPLVIGYDYTKKLRAAVAKSLGALKAAKLFTGHELSTSVFTILRGGLNFQIREALADAFSWNRHSSWFVSAQRELVDATSGKWKIIEDSYCKVFADQPEIDVIFGDVVATGTSFAHGLGKLRQFLGKENKYRSVTFFTIGGPLTTDILSEWTAEMSEAQGKKVKSTVVYFEGIFGVASSESPLRIKIPGTDLIRRDAVMSPEFVKSQYKNPAFPLERCTIYDAGSRAFHFSEYLNDVSYYWRQMLALAENGCTFEELVRERCPSIEPKKFGKVDLAKISKKQIKRCELSSGSTR